MFICHTFVEHLPLSRAVLSAGDTESNDTKHRLSQKQTIDKCVDRSQKRILQIVINVKEKI